MYRSKRKKNTTRTTPSTRTGKHPERAFQIEAVSLISQHIKGDVEWTHFPAGGGGKMRGIYLKRMGLKPGWPDLIFVQDGHLYGLELKVGVGRLSENQVHRHHRLSMCGATLGTARTLEEVFQFLSSQGLLKISVNQPCRPLVN